MKYQQRQTKLKTNFGSNGINMGIDNSQKALELLYSQYSYPIRTMVQELISNAFDAMEKAGKGDTPIKVELPNAINDYVFKVKDTGTGMSYDTFKKVYCQVTASTKANTNTQIGGFGIGSKVPFALVDSFVVASTFNGKKYQYIITKNPFKSSMPIITETDEPNGVEIIVKANKFNADEYREAYIRATMFAKVKPLVNDITLNEPFATQKVNSFVRLARVKNLPYKFDSAVVILLGGIPYELSYDFKNTKIYRNISDIVANRHTLFIDMPIGSLKPLQTRESLDMSGKNDNRAMLKKVFKWVTEQVTEKLKKEDAKQKTLNDLIKFRTLNRGFRVDLPNRDIDGIQVGKDFLKFDYKNFESPIKELTRNKEYGWRNEKTKNTKSKDARYLDFADLDNTYVNDLVGTKKAKLAKRFRDMLETTDKVFIVPQTDEYKVLLDNLELDKVSEVDFDDTVTPRAKGVSREGFVRYTKGGRREGRIVPTATKKVALFDLDRENRYTLSYHSRYTDKLREKGYRVAFVKPSVYNKWINTEHCYDGNSIVTYKDFKEDYVKHKQGELYENAVSKYDLNLDSSIKNFLIGTIDENKVKLLTNKGYKYASWYKPYPEQFEQDLAQYEARALKPVKKVLKRRLRAKGMLESVPLLEHVNFYDMSEAARNDLKQYVTSKLGEANV